MLIKPGESGGWIYVSLTVSDAPDEKELAKEAATCSPSSSLSLCLSALVYSSQSRILIFLFLTFRALGLIS